MDADHEPTSHPATPADSDGSAATPTEAAVARESTPTIEPAPKGSEPTHAAESLGPKGVTAAVPPKESPEAEGGGGESPEAGSTGPSAASEEALAAESKGTRAATEEASAAETTSTSAAAGETPAAGSTGTSAASGEAPASEPTPAEAASTPGAGEPESANTAKRSAKGKGVRERLANDRALQAARRRALLTGRLATAFLVLLVLAGLAFLARRPLLRTLARSGKGELNQWALNYLAGLEDPGAFDLYVANMGTRSDHYTPLVYRLAGRSRAPDESGVPPDDPSIVAEHTQTLIKAVREEDPDLQRGGLRAFSCLRQREWIRDPELLQSVADALSSQDVVARRFAAIGMRNVAPTPAHQVRLLNTVRSDTDRLVRRFAVQALARSEDPSLGPELAALEDEAPEVQRELFLALARLGVPVPFVRLRVLYSEFPTLRQTVVESLVKRSEAGVDDLIEGAIRDTSPGTRLAAAKALRDRERPEGLDALCYALGDADPAVRLESIDSILARPDGLRALRSLVAALEDHQGWEELRRLHVALKTLTKHQGVPDPLQSQELTWTRTQGAWRSYLRKQGKR